MKKYVKPTFEYVDLRVEESLACRGKYKKGKAKRGCFVVPGS